MSNITNIKDWLEDHLMENENDDDNLCAAKYTEWRQRVKVKKVVEEWRKTMEEAMRRGVEEVRRHKAEEAKHKAEEVAEAAAKRQVSLFRDQRRLLADQAGQADS